MIERLQKSILRQREILADMLAVSMLDMARRLRPLMADRAALEELLREELKEMEFCKHLYVLDEHFIQVTANVTRSGLDIAHYGRDRSRRAYMQGIVGTTDFKMSEAYISRNQKRPSITAVQVIRNPAGERIGFLGADYDLRELPHTALLYQEPTEWRQIKGDPAIRGGLFAQQRVESVMDRHIDDVLALVNELFLEHGIFHIVIHFSSSRATVWLVDDPYNYRILGVDELLDPDICLAFPRRPYDESVQMPVGDILPVLRQFRDLRFADDNIYLRSASLNTRNGLVSLTFSCDGSHYVPYREFLDRGMNFWFGNAGQEEPDPVESWVERICERGCDVTRDVLRQVGAGDIPEDMQSLSPIHRDAIVRSLRDIMDVYDRPRNRTK